jgi:hypothetical protein
MIQWIKQLAHANGAALTFLLAIFSASWAGAGEFRLLSAQEPSIADIRAAIAAKDLTCRQLVQMYLDRIEAYDKKSPSLNAIIVVNPNMLAEADRLDARFSLSGFVGPLHCVPMIIKDNYDVLGFPTTAGSLSLKDSMPPRDAFQVRKLREAGALVLAKSNMAEFARSPYETVGSLLPGHTRNPYALDRVPAGSSGGRSREFRRRGSRDRYREFHPRACLPYGPRRHPLDDGADQPRRYRAVVPSPGYRRSAGAQRCRCGGRL